MVFVRIRGVLKRFGRLGRRCVETGETGADRMRGGGPEPARRLHDYRLDRLPDGWTR